MTTLTDAVKTQEYVLATNTYYDTLSNETTIDITLEKIELPNENEWHVYWEGMDLGTAVVEHEYYRETANDDKYLTQAQIYNLLDKRISALENWTNWLFYGLKNQVLVAWNSISYLRKPSIKRKQ